MERLTYFIITRKLFSSPIWREDPHLLKLFLYLVGKARYRKTPKRFLGFEVRRGELVTSLQDIVDANQYSQGRVKHSWTRMRVSRMLHRLENMQQIELLRDTYGTHIKICNYDKYQSIDTYKFNDGVTSSVTSPLRDCYEGVTRVLPYNKDKKVNKGKKSKKVTGHPSGTFFKKSLSEKIKFLKHHSIFEDADLFADDFHKNKKWDEKLICHAFNQLFKKSKNGDDPLRRWEGRQAWAYCEKIIDSESAIKNAQESEKESARHKESVKTSGEILNLANSVTKSIDKELTREQKLDLLHQQAAKLRKDGG